MKDNILTSEHNENVIRQAVTEAYNRGYEQGKNDVKGMVLDAFEVWEDALAGKIIAKDAT